MFFFSWGRYLRGSKGSGGRGLTESLIFPCIVELTIDLSLAFALIYNICLNRQISALCCDFFSILVAICPEQTVTSLSAQTSSPGWLQDVTQVREACFSRPFVFECVVGLASEIRARVPLSLSVCIFASG